MQLLIDLLPVIIFFVVYKAAGMYWATAALIVAVGVQVAVQWFRHKTISKMLITSAVLVTVLGGITLMLRDPLFIQWKVTAVNWLFAIAFLGSAFIGQKTLTERIMGHAVELPAHIWRQLNLMWVANFVVLGAANLFVMYNFDEETWVDFKLFGTLGLTFLTAIAQGVLIWNATRESDEKPEGSARSAKIE